MIISIIRINRPIVKDSLNLEHTIQSCSIIMLSKYSKFLFIYLKISFMIVIFKQKVNYIDCMKVTKDSHQNAIFNYLNIQIIFFFNLINYNKNMNIIKKMADFLIWKII